MPRTKKDKFEDLPEEFKNSVAGMDETAIRDTITKVSLNQASLMEAKELDQDLSSKKEAAKEAGAIYREGTKSNKLKVAWCRQVLGDKGKETNG
jgi:hypothetical protein